MILARYPFTEGNYQLRSYIVLDKILVYSSGVHTISQIFNDSRLPHIHLADYNFLLMS